MDVSKQSLKGVAKVGLAAMAGLFITALLFYRERVLFADASYVLFHIINDKKLAIQESRYGSFVTQMVPYFGQKLHLSLKAILIGYGVSFNLFFFSVNAILVYVLKQYRLAILMALYYFLFFSESFIWVSEVPQGIAWMFLMYGVVIYLGGRKSNIALLAVSFLVLGALALFTHFVIAVPFIYLWVFFIIDKGSWPFSRNASLLLTVLIGCIIAVKFLLSTGGNATESALLHGVTHFSIKDVIESFTKPEVTAFLWRCLINYWAGTIVFILGMIALISSKQYMQAVWTVLSVAGYMIIIGLTYGDLDGTTQLFHIESEWSCIGIIAATPFVFAFLPGIRSSIATCLVAGIFVVRMVYIISFLPPFTARINMTEQILTQMRKKGITKLALYNDVQLITASKLYWGLPFESVMRSSMDGDKPQLTFMFVNPGDKRVLDCLKDPKGFFDAYANFPCSQLYFNVDSTKPYQVMTYAELLK